jgi:hypothetical protein
VIAVFDLDAHTIVLFVEILHVALHISKHLVEPVFVPGNLLS